MTQLKQESLPNNDGTVRFFQVAIAGKKIEIECRYKLILSKCRDYLASFDQPDFVIRATPEDIAAEQGRIDQPAALFREGLAVTTVDRKALESFAVCRKVSEAFLNYGTLLIHAAAVAVEQRCWLFLAPSGTGKTTHINRWLEMIPGAYVVNGDKPLVNTKTGLVYGTPWCGKENMNTNTGVPLAGLIDLRRGETNEIRRVSFRTMLPCLLRQTYIPRAPELSRKALNAVGALKEIPCYQLTCNTEKEAALVSYAMLKEDAPSIP